LRETYLDNIAMQLYADMRQQPITVFPDRLEAGQREIVPIVLEPIEVAAPPRPVRFLLHRVQGEHYIGLIPRQQQQQQQQQQQPLPQRPERETSIARSLSFVEDMAVEFRKKRKESRTEGESSTGRAGRKRGPYKKGQKRQRDLEAATTMALKSLRRGEEPPEPTVDGSLRGNYLTKARRDADVQREAIERARELFRQEQSPSGQDFQRVLEQARVVTPRTPTSEQQQRRSRSFVLDSAPSLGVAVASSAGLDFVPFLLGGGRGGGGGGADPRNNTGREEVQGNSNASGPRSGNGADVQDAHEHHSEGEESDSSGDSNDVEFNIIRPEPTRGDEADTRPKRKKEAPARRCSKCSCTEQTRPGLNWVECSGCQDAYHVNCVSAWYSANETEPFTCRGCDPNQKRRK
jgi:hypothetical protein